MSNKLLSTIAFMGLTVASMTSCDSLWNSFTKPDPDDCASEGNVCSDSGDIRMDSIIPRQMPISGGLPISINGQGFLPKTDVLIGTSPLSNVKITNDVISGTVPRAQARCGLFDVTLTRSDGKQAVVPNGFTYTLDPYISKPSVGIYSHTFKTTNIIVDDFNGDQKPDIAMSLNDRFGVILSAGTTVSKTISPPLTQSSFIQSVHFNSRLAVRTTAIATLNNTRNTIGVFSYNPSKQLFEFINTISFLKEVRIMLSGDLDQNGNDGILVVTNNENDATKDNVHLIGFVQAADTYQSSPAIFQAVNKIDSMILANLSNDTYPDIVSSAAGRVVVLKRNGTEGAEIVRYPASLFSLTSGDWNGDGKIDIAGLDLMNQKVVLVLNNGSQPASVLTASAGFLSSSQTILVAGDLNCDQRADIAVMQTANTTDTPLKIISLSPLGQVEVKDSAQALPAGPMVIGDFNQDGNPDLIIGRNKAVGTDTLFVAGSVY
uniref:Vcbs n=1 Tax=uncultured bacterium A1Q1_fos_565 TaxID=1256585 RepID=L7VY89_9BACT|nr:vcbs [uncultured bacterium A1Q1_fos_565]